VGRLETDYAKVAGHKNNVLDVAWNPFDENEIAAADENGEVKIWTIPDGGLTCNLEDPKLVLAGHNKKVSGFLFVYIILFLF